MTGTPTEQLDPSPPTLFCYLMSVNNSPCLKFGNDELSPGVLSDALFSEKLSRTPGQTRNRI